MYVILTTLLVAAKLYLRRLLPTPRRLTRRQPTLLGLERNQAIDALMKDNPDMTDDQLVELLPAKIAEVQKANADKANKKVCP